MSSTAAEATVEAPTRCRKCGIHVGIGADGFCDNCREADLTVELDGSDTAALAPYHELEQRIRGSEREALLARWEFGRVLLTEREANGGKKLPNGRLEELANALAIGRTELKNRIQFAEEYPDADAALAEFGSWHEICRRGLGDRRDAKQRERQARTPANTYAVPERFHERIGRLAQHAQRAGLIDDDTIGAALEVLLDHSESCPAFRHQLKKKSRRAA